MANLGVKNVSKSKYIGMFDGVPYEFMPGELRILESEVAMHIRGNSNLSAIGGYALKVVPLAEIPEELRREPETRTDSLWGVKNPTDKVVEIRFDGRFHTFPKGHVAYFPKEVANELINRSVEGGKASLVKFEAKKEAPTEKKEEKKEKKEGK